MIASSPVFRARHAAGHWRVDHMPAERRHLLRQFLRDRWDSGTHFDHDGPRLQPGEHIVIATTQHSRNDGAGRQHGDHHVGHIRELAQRVRRGATDLLGEVVGDLAAGIVDLHHEAGAHQAGGHRPAHIADADEADSWLS